VTLLTTVENSFEVPARGCYITPRQWESDLRIRQKDKIQLKTPHGNILNTYIAWIELGTATSGTFMAIGLPRPITKRTVPNKTEIWLIEQQAS
jgi:hypothetical protein